MRGTTLQVRALVRSDRRSGVGKLSLALQNCNTSNEAQGNPRWHDNPMLPEQH